MDLLVYSNQDGESITDSVKVSMKFGKRHSDVLRDIQDLTCSQDFRERNFALSSYISSQGKELPKWEMNKDGFTFLVMGYSGDRASKFKEDYIQEFNKREVLLNSNEYILARANQIISEQNKKLEEDYNKERNLRVDIEKQKKLIEAQNIEKNRQIREMKPKAEFHDDVTLSDQEYTLSSACKMINSPYGRNKMFDVLRKDGVVFKDRNEVKQQYTDRFAMRLSRPKGNGKRYPYLAVNGKGLAWMRKKYSPQLELI